MNVVILEENFLVEIHTSYTYSDKNKSVTAVALTTPSDCTWGIHFGPSNSGKIHTSIATRARSRNSESLLEGF